MLVLKFTCDDEHHLNSKLVADKFIEAIGQSKEIAIKDGPDTVKLYLGQKQANNVSITIEVTDEDIKGCIKED